VTFEEMRGYWPRQVDDTTGNTEHLNRVAKYVVSSTMSDPQWENSTVLSGPLIEEIEALKAQPVKDIVTTGSITLVHDLIARGLVDEYRLFVFPVVPAGSTTGLATLVGQSNDSHRQGRPRVGGDRRGP
jgi:dihydrofolate reductase